MPNKKPQTSDVTVNINCLQLMAMQLSEQLTDEEELRKRDVTALWKKGRLQILAKKGLINAQFRGLPGSGKSTAMIAELYNTNQLLGKPTTLDHIMPNQIVYIQVMRRVKQRMDCCIGVDEFDEMGETGYNATTDAAGLNSFSDLGRAYYIHRFSCSPKDTMDKNAYLIFDVIGADFQHKFTRCHLSYKLLKQGVEHEQLLGYVDIDVSEVIETDFYREYDERKMRRLRLFSEYGIVHERHIFFAKVLLDAYCELRDIARTGKVEKGMAELQIDMSARKLRMVNSILGASKFTSDLIALLQYAHYQEKEKELLRKLPTLKGFDPLRIEALSAEHSKILHRLQEQEQKVVEYWQRAASLEPIYISNLAVEAPHETGLNQENQLQSQQHVAPARRVRPGVQRPRARQRLALPRVRQGLGA